MLNVSKPMRALASLAVLLVSTAASAETDRCAPADAQVPVTFHVEQRGAERVVVIEPVIVLCGHPPRPNVAYVTSAKSIHYEWETLQQDFLPAILRSIAKGPF